MVHSPKSNVSEIMAVEVKSNLNMQVDPALGLRIRFEFQSTWVWYSQA